jgi:hypothetical protein
MPEQNRLEKKDLVDLLFRKYSLLKSEVHLQMTYYKRHARSVQIVATAVSAAASYLIVENKFAPTNDNLLVWSLGLLVALSVLCYFIYDILDCLYDINILGERMAVLEKQINDIAESNLLIWETKVSERVHVPPIPMRGVLPPYVMLQTYITILLTLVLLLFPNLVAFVLWKTPMTSYAFLKKALIVIDVVFSIASAAGLVIVARGLFTKVRPGAREIMQAAASEKWASSEATRVE